MVGLEPTTFCLTGNCSTDWATSPYLVEREGIEPSFEDFQSSTYTMFVIFPYGRRGRNRTHIFGVGNHYVTVVTTRLYFGVNAGNRTQTPWVEAKNSVIKLQIHME